MRVVYWGTYDTGKPRNRIMIRGLRENGVEVVECHREVWSGVEDKSQISGLRGKLEFLVRWVLCYPILLWRYMRLPRHDAVVVGYLGHLDVLLLWPFANVRGVPIVWDAFLSLYNTVVEDRSLVDRHNTVACLLYAWEWLACRAADLVLLDTQAHARYFVECFGIPAERVQDVLVGVEPELFPASAQQARHATFSAVTVLFYGQFIPLHGVETIIRAARMAKPENIDWVLIGKGQEAAKIQTMLDNEPLPRVRWIPWVLYEELIDWIHRADICLGIFGDTHKAALVIPNKVFQIISAGKPLVTRDSPAVCELVSKDSSAVVLSPPADPGALLAAVYSLADRLKEGEQMQHVLRQGVTPQEVGARLKEVIDQLAGFPGKFRA